jgi:hypothetical protein
LSIKRPEIFNELDLGSVVAIKGCDEGLFLNIKWPVRLSVQFITDLSAPCSPLLEIRTKRMKEQNSFRLSGSLARLRLSGSLAHGVDKNDSGSNPHINKPLQQARAPSSGAAPVVGDYSGETSPTLD